MRTLRSVMLVLSVVLAGAVTASADSFTAYFTTYYDGSTGPAAGQVTLTLNSDGTIAVDAEEYNGTPFQYFGINSASTLTLVDFSQTPDSVGPVDDDFGVFATTLTYDFANNTTNEVAFTIDGDYSSVYQVLNGPVATSENFLIDDGDDIYGADAPAPTNVTPEPGSLMLLGTGALAMAAAMRRRLAR